MLVDDVDLPFGESWDWTVQMMDSSLIETILSFNSAFSNAITWGK